MPFICCVTHWSGFDDQTYRRMHCMDVHSGKVEGFWMKQKSESENYNIKSTVFNILKTSPKTKFLYGHDFEPFYFLDCYIIKISGHVYIFGVRKVT